MSKIFKLKYLPYLLFGISIVLLVYFMFNMGAMDADWTANNKHIGDNAAYASLSTFLTWAYILSGIALLLALVLPLINMIKNPQNLKKMLINVGLIVVVFVIAFLLASGDPLPSISKTVTEASSQSIKTIDTGLIVTYILIAVSFGAIIWGALRNTIKNR